MSIFTEQEFDGFYGSESTPCTIFYYDGWYCVQGSEMVNRTYDEITEGTNVEDLSDYDCFTWSGPIETIEEFIEAIES